MKRTWTLGAVQFEDDPTHEVLCGCGRTGSAHLRTVGMPGDPKVMRWFEPPAGWLVALSTTELYVMCPDCRKGAAPKDGTDPPAG